MLSNKTASECWNIIKYVIESIINQYGLDIPERMKTTQITKRHSMQLQKIASNIKNDSKSSYAYIRSKQNVRDKVGPLEDSAGNIISQGFVQYSQTCFICFTCLIY